MSRRLERDKGLKENKGLKIVGNILYWTLVVLTVLILLVVLMQRFSDNTVALGGFRIFNVITESMMPKYNVGDVLLAKTQEISEINIGDDVVYKGEKGDFADKIVTHQVIDIEEKDGEYIFHTKGLANEEEDPEVAESQIMGVVVYKIRTLSIITKTINNLYSFYFIIFLPLVVLMFIEGRKMVLNLKNAKDEDGK